MYDRSYMRPSNFEDLAKKTLIWIVGINAGIFLLQKIVNASEAAGFMERTFGLSIGTLTSGYLWTPLTYAFLHDTQQYFHILLNMLLIFMIGRQLFPILGQKRFLQLYLGTALTGGIVFLLVNLIHPTGFVVGASGVWYGMLAFFVLLAPEEEILFMFVLRMKRKILGFILLGLGLVGFVFDELLSGGTGTAHSAHLGGMLGGYLFFKYVYAANPYDTSGRLNISIPKFFRKPEPKAQAKSFRYNVNVSRKPEDLKREVDRILDKINNKGFGSLSGEEKQVLDDAKDLLRKR